MDRSKAAIVACGLVLAVASSQSLGDGVRLDEALALASANALELKDFDADAAIANAQSEASSGAYDVHYFLGGQYEKDRSESLSTFEGEARTSQGAETGVRKLFSSGTQTTLKYLWNQADTDFPAPPPPILLPTGEALNFNDPETTRRYNPAYRQALQLQLIQPLWRGFWAREIRLQSELAKFPVTTASYQKAAARQAIMAQTENLFIELLRTEALLSLTTELVQKSKKFLNLMQNRINLGRADRVDTAAAEASLIGYEGDEVRLRINKQQLQSELAWRIDPTKPSANLKISGTLTQSPLPPPLLDERRALAAISGRYDTRLLDQRMKPLQLRSELTEEKEKPELNLILLGETSGIDGTSDEATSKATEARYLRYEVGLQFNWNLQNRQHQGERHQLAAERVKITQLKEQLIRETARDIRLAILQHQSSFQLRRQAERHIESLNKQMQAERRKFRQARAEEIGALRYEIEAIGAKRALIDADYTARKAEASLRLALHRYEGKTK